jgi:hypothetical protein
MLTMRELLWLHALQSDLAAKKDWTAVGHVQSLIDHMADEHGLRVEVRDPARGPLAVH